MTRTAATVSDPPGLRPDGDAQRLAVSIQRGDDRDTVHVRGELDTVTVPLLEAVLEHLAGTGSPSVTLDLGQVSFADSHGLEPLLAAGVAGRAVLVRASPAVARLLPLLAARPTADADQTDTLKGSSCS